MRVTAKVIKQITLLALIGSMLLVLGELLYVLFKDSANSSLDPRAISFIHLPTLIMGFISLYVLWGRSLIGWLATIIGFYGLTFGFFLHYTGLLQHYEYWVKHQGKTMYSELSFAWGVLYVLSFFVCVLAACVHPSLQKGKTESYGIKNSENTQRKLV